MMLIVPSGVYPRKESTRKKMSEIRKATVLNRVCLVEGCRGNYHSSGFCKKHYFVKYQQDPKNKTKRSDVKRKSNTKMRIEAIKLIGTKCDSCGQKLDLNNPSNLQFHHKYYDDVDKEELQRTGRLSQNIRQVRNMAKNGINPKTKFGLLCHQCNIIEAYVRKDPETAFEAFSWLVAEGYFDEAISKDDYKKFKKLTDFIK